MNSANFDGLIESISGYNVTGWALLKTDLNLKAKIRVYFENVSVSETVADIPREEFLEIGDGKFGFTVGVDSNFFDLVSLKKEPLLFQADFGGEDVYLIGKIEPSQGIESGSLDKIKNIVTLHKNTLKQILFILKNYSPVGEHENYKKYCDELFNLIVSGDVSKSTVTLESFRKVLDIVKKNNDLKSKFPVGNKTRHKLNEVIKDKHGLMPSRSKLELLSFLEPKNNFKVEDVGINRNYISWYLNGFLKEHNISYEDIYDSDYFDLKGKVYLSESHYFPITKYLYNVWLSNEFHRKMFDISKPIECALYCLDFLFSLIETPDNVSAESYFFPEEAFEFWFQGQGSEILKEMFPDICFENITYKITPIEIRRGIQNKKWRHGLTVLGHFGNGSGLTQSAIMSAEILKYRGYGVNTIDVEKYPYTQSKFIGQKNLVYSNEIYPPETKNISMALYHVNANRASPLFYSLYNDQFRPEINVGFFFWELDVIPEDHKPILNMLDQIWVQSDFLKDVYSKYFKSPVINVRGCLPLPMKSNLNRKHFSIPKDAYVYLVAFDQRSSVTRKNPLAAVKMFSETFRKSDDVFMVIKTFPSNIESWGDPENQMGQIKELARKHKNILILERYLTLEDLFSLIDCCDCYVTTHKAEGFGYFAAYAGMFKKNVIATNYSGTCDFLTEKNSFLVDYDLVKVNRGEFFQVPENSHWANVKLDSLYDAFKNSRDKYLGNRLYNTVSEMYKFETYKNKLKTVLEFKC